MTFGKYQALLWEHPMTCGGVPGAQLCLPLSDRNAGTTTPCYFHFQPWKNFIPSSFNPNNSLQAKLFISSWPYHPTHRCNNTLHTHGIILITSRNKHHPSQGNWDEEKVSMFSGPGFTSSVWFYGSVDILTPPFLQFHGKFQPPLE